MASFFDTDRILKLCLPLDISIIFDSILLKFKMIKKRRKVHTSYLIALESEVADVVDERKVEEW